MIITFTFLLYIQITRCFIKRESFENGIKNEMESINSELAEIREKRDKAEKIIEEKK